MKTSKTVWVIVAIIVVLLGGWYFMSMRSAQPEVYPSANVGLNGSSNQTNTGQAAVAPVVTVSSSPKLGNYLVAANGMTLYMFAKDTVNVSNCSGACSINWPSYSPLANEPLVAGAGITGELNTITRTDGSKQLTYKGLPVYFWKNDVKPGDTTGEGIAGLWSVIKP